MQLLSDSFQSLDVDISERVHQFLLKNIEGPRFNMQLNLFNITNPLFCLYLLISKRLHVTRIHCVGDTFNSAGLFSYWENLGVEVQHIVNLYSLPAETLTNPIQILQISNQSQDQIREYFDQFLSGSIVAVINKNSEVRSAEQIWGFMEGYWPYMNIVDFQFVADKTSSANILCGYKR